MSNIACPLCNSPLMVSSGEYNSAFVCTEYPLCDFIFNFWDKKVECSMCCHNLRIRGDNFVSCSDYPDCPYSLHLYNDAEKIQEILDNNIEPY